MAVTAPAFETIDAPAAANRRRRYTEDQVPIGRVLLRMLGGLIVLVIFILPYTIMFFGSVKTKAQIRSVEPTYFPTEWHWENYVNMWSTPETPLPQNLISTIVIAVFATRARARGRACPRRTTRRGSGSPGASCSSSS